MHPYLMAAQSLMDGLSELLGADYEVILHDLSHVESSVVAIRGDITHRKVGAPATNYLMRLLKEYGDDAPNSVNYRNELPDRRVLRSSTLFIRDDEGRILGSLCINQDLTEYIAARNLLENNTKFSGQPRKDAPPQELFASEISELMENMVDGEIHLARKMVAYMQKDEKMAMVENLERKGVFDVKGAVEYVADRLGVTNYTIYNYLKEIKSKTARQQRETAREQAAREKLG